MLLKAESFLTIALFAAANCRTIGYHQQDFINSEAQDEVHDYYAPINYKYSYGVEDQKNGDYKSHKEERTGDVVKGEYSVLGPDGILRTVTYYVDKHSGFQAVVTKSGEGIVNPEVDHAIDQGHLNNLAEDSYAPQIHQQSVVTPEIHSPINFNEVHEHQQLLAPIEGKNLIRQHNNEYRHVEYISPNYYHFNQKQQQPQYNLIPARETTQIQPDYEHKINWY